MTKLPSSNKVIKVLTHNGFLLKSQKGSHQKYTNGHRTVIVPSPRKQIEFNISAPPKAAIGRLLTKINERDHSNQQGTKNKEQQTINPMLFPKFAPTFPRISPTKKWD